MELKKLIGIKILFLLLLGSTKGQITKFEILPKIAGKCYLKFKTIPLQKKLISYPTLSANDYSEINLDTITKEIVPSYIGLGYKREFGNCEETYMDCIELIRGKKPARTQEIIYVTDYKDSTQFVQKDYEYYEKKEIELAEYWAEIDCDAWKKKTLDWAIEGNGRELHKQTKEKIDKQIVSLFSKYSDAYVEIRIHTKQKENWQEAIKDTEVRLMNMIQYLKSQGVEEIRILGLAMGDLAKKGDKIEFQIKT